MNEKDKEFQEERHQRVKRLKEMKAPDFLIEFEERISKMTLAEYNSYRHQEIKEDKKIKSEYAKNTPIQQSIIDEIYNRESRLEYDSCIYSDKTHLLMAINPLEFMSQEDYSNDLYETFLDHAMEIYRDRFKYIWN